jgi:hypothetical protein
VTNVDENCAAPARFLPEFDNAVPAHQDRTRIISATDYRRGIIIGGKGNSPRNRIRARDLGIHQREKFGGSPVRHVDQSGTRRGTGGRGQD